MYFQTQSLPSVISSLRHGDYHSSANPPIPFPYAVNPLKTSPEYARAGEYGKCV